MNTRRRVLIGGGGVKYIFQSGTARINGTVARESGVTVRAENILISVSGCLSVKTDFSRFEKLYIDIALLGLSETTDHGIQYGFGGSETAFTKSETKYTAALETKVFDIANVTGEQYINFVNSSYTDSLSAYIYNIRLEG